MSTSVIFRLRGIRPPENHRVAVVGSSPTLGSWAPKKTCFLEKGADDTYQLCIEVEGSSTEYKYVLLHGSEIQWEGGENRMVDTTKGDGECNDTWMAAGASGFITRTDAGDIPKEVDEEVHEGTSEVQEDAAAAPRADVVTHEGSLLRDGDTSGAKVYEDIRSGEKHSPEKDQKRVLQTDDPNIEHDREPDSGDTKEPFVRTRGPRSPFLLIDSIFKLCRRRASNAN